MKIIRLGVLSLALLLAQTNAHANLVTRPIIEKSFASKVSTTTLLPIEPNKTPKAQKKNSSKQHQQHKNNKLGRWEGIFLIASLCSATLALVFQIGMMLEIANSFIYTAYSIMLGTVSILWMAALVFLAVALVGLILRWMKKHREAKVTQ